MNAASATPVSQVAAALIGAIANVNTAVAGEAEAELTDFSMCGMCSWHLSDPSRQPAELSGQCATWIAKRESVPTVKRNTGPRLFMINNNGEPTLNLTRPSEKVRGDAA